MNVKGLVHKVQTYQVICLNKDNEKKQKVIKEDYDGFSLAVDLNNLKKEQVIFSLKKAIEKIEKEN